MKPTIRKATEEDFSAILTLVKEFAAHQNKEDQVSNTIELMKAEQDSFNCLVAEVESKIVGFASFFFCYYSWTGKSLYLDDLFVSKSHRNLDIGSSLLKEIIEIGKTNNCKKVRWQVANYNEKAIDFYKEFGAKIGDIEVNCDLQLS